MYFIRYLFFIIITFPYYNLASNITNLTSINQTTDVTTLEKMISEKCKSRYNYNCLMYDLSKVIDRLSSKFHSYQVLPGVFLVQNTTINDVDVRKEILLPVSSSKEVLQKFVIGKINKFLNSFSLSVNIMDPRSLFSVRGLASDIVTSILPSPDGRHRKKGQKGSSWGKVAMAAAGALLTGKAMVASMAALLLALLCFMKSHGGHLTSHLTGSAVMAPQYSPYSRQCNEAIVDVSGYDPTATLIGVRKRTDDIYAQNIPTFPPSTHIAHMRN